MHTPVEQTAQLLGIGLSQGFKVDVSCTRIIHVGRNRGGSWLGPQGTGNIARPQGIGCSKRIASSACQSCRSKIHHIGKLREPVVSLSHRACPESIRFDHIGTGKQVLMMNVVNQCGLGEAQ